MTPITQDRQLSHVAETPNKPSIRFEEGYSYQYTLDYRIKPKRPERAFPHTTRHRLKTSDGTLESQRPGRHVRLEDLVVPAIGLGFRVSTLTLAPGRQGCTASRHAQKGLGFRVLQSRYTEQEPSNGSCRASGVLSGSSSPRSLPEACHGYDLLTSRYKGPILLTGGECKKPAVLVLSGLTVSECLCQRLKKTAAASKRIRQPA